MIASSNRGDRPIFSVFDFPTDLLIDLRSKALCLLNDPYQKKRHDIVLLVSMFVPR